MQEVRDDQVDLIPAEEKASPAGFEFIYKLDRQELKQSLNIGDTELYKLLAIQPSEVDTLTLIIKVKSGTQGQGGPMPEVDEDHASQEHDAATATVPKNRLTTR